MKYIVKIECPSSTECLRIKQEECIRGNEHSEKYYVLVMNIITTF